MIKHASNKAGNQTRNNMTNVSKSSNKSTPTKKCRIPSLTVDGGSARGSKTVKARLPKGLRDIGEREAYAQNRMLRALSEVCTSWGFSALETPILEYADALGKFLPDEERPNAGVFSLRDDDEQWLALRYDLTAPLARYVAENYDSLPKPFRRYQHGPVFRNEKPDPGRFRQFMQFDADIVGAPVPLADAELCALAAKCMDTLGLKEKYSLHISNRKLLDGLLESIGLNKNESGFAEKRLRVLRSIDKMERLGARAVTDLLGMGRKDKSGDYTPGAGLDQKAIEKVLALVEGHIDFPSLEAIMGETASGKEGIEQLHEMIDLMKAFGVNEDVIELDPTVVRGLDYYTGPIFEIKMSASDSRLTRFGSVGGGGRYDDLVTRFKGIEIPAAGFSIGISRLYTVLEAMKESSAIEGETLDVVILLLDSTDRTEAVRITRELREANIRAEVYLGSSGMRAQMRYADRRSAKLAIIQGEQERKRNEITIRNLVLGKELSASIKDSSQWKEGGEAQRSVARERLLEEVSKTLASQK